MAKRRLEDAVLRGRVRPALGLQRGESPAEGYPRVRLDLFVDITAEQEAEVERLAGLGAGGLAWDLYPPDPDGDVFAL